ncbi:MAG: deoxyribose-phosphate aldolase [Parcubacteria group bacterium CG11_big_fil_rev_8_21_14_0_20_39_14]|nr:MAG: deoxyribose-phosphate aldolase [Parcubacteria group bacterium CG11_big_fil_rev_8_21_14_0_20_39_14]PIS35263.1 MAG: deoxyribose-phosphate aldolase [Parcubacteria group bacterium CG08_land_8_20_14_0_20_38_56]
MEITRIIDYTNLKPEATETDIKKLCQEAKEYGFRAVCVNPIWVPFCVDKLKGTSTKIASVIDFPLGAGGTQNRLNQVKIAKETGASEIDIVMPSGLFKSGNYQAVLDDLKAIVGVGLPIKVIIETGLLTDEEIKKASGIVKESGAFCVKTSTGFMANIDIDTKVGHVRLMREAVGPDFQIKAAGGIKTLKDIKRLLEAGANIIGTSAGVEIMKEMRNS